MTETTRLSVEPIERPRPRAVETPPAIAAPEPAPTPAPGPEPKTDAWDVAVRILSVRALLGFALAGAFILAVTAILKGGWLPLVGLGIYLTLTVIPVAALEIRRR